MILDNQFCFGIMNLGFRSVSFPALDSRYTVAVR